MILQLALIFTTLNVIILSFVCYRLTTKLFQFDELFEMMTDEFDTNIRYFDKLLKTPLFMDSPEIAEAQKNMRVMSMRLEEYTFRMGDVRGKEKKKKEAGANDSPWVV